MITSLKITQGGGGYDNYNTYFACLFVFWYTKNDQTAELIGPLLYFCKIFKMLEKIWGNPRKIWWVALQ